MVLEFGLATHNIAGEVSRSPNVLKRGRTGLENARRALRAFEFFLVVPKVELAEKEANEMIRAGMSKGGSRDFFDEERLLKVTEDE